MSGRVMVRSLCAAALVASLGACIPIPVGGGSPVPANQRDAAAKEIVSMMNASAQAWNRGDLDGFVSYYEPDMTTTFIGRTGIVRGRAAIRAVYAPRFAPGGVRDSLSFENVNIDVLAPGLANVIAWYRLTRGDSTTGHGPTSLVMRRDGDGTWRIVHDHSS